MHLSLFGPWPSCFVLLPSQRLGVFGYPMRRRVQGYHGRMLRCTSYMGAKCCIAAKLPCPAAPVAGPEASSNVWLSCVLPWDAVGVPVQRYRDRSSKVLSK